MQLLLLIPVPATRWDWWCYKLFTRITCRYIAFCVFARFALFRPAPHNMPFQLLPHNPSLLFSSVVHSPYLCLLIGPSSIYVLSCYLWCLILFNLFLVMFRSRSPFCCCCVATCSARDASASASSFFLCLLYCACADNQTTQDSAGTYTRINKKWMIIIGMW